MSSICLAPVRPVFLRSATALSSREAYCGLVAAARMSDGLVVASCGLNSLIDSKSPVSATTLGNFLSCSSWLNFVEVGASTVALMGSFLGRLRTVLAAGICRQLDGLSKRVTGDNAEFRGQIRGVFR